VSAAEPEPVADLLARWEARLRDSSVRSRQTNTGDLQAAYYFRGVADTYKAALAELRALLADPEAPPDPTEALLQTVTDTEVSAMLSRIGLFPRLLRRHDDGAFTALFSRLQPVSAARRAELLRGADPRLRILHEGTLQDTGDPYVEFGFVNDD
jgi:hypothetical protein